MSQPQDSEKELGSGAEGQAELQPKAMEEQAEASQSSLPSPSSAEEQFAQLSGQEVRAEAFLSRCRPCLRPAVIPQSDSSPRQLQGIADKACGLS